MYFLLGYWFSMGVGMGTVFGWFEVGTWLLGDYIDFLVVVFFYLSVWY